MEKEIIPKGLVNWWDIVKGVGQVAVETLLYQLHSEGLSDYPKHPHTNQPLLPFDSEGNWHNPDGLAVGD